MPDTPAVMRCSDCHLEVPEKRRYLFRCDCGSTSFYGTITAHPAPVSFATHELMQEIAAGTVVTIPSADLAALRADAERYRFLRDLCDYEGPHGGWPNPGTPIALVIGLDHAQHRYPMSVTGEQLDAAIDAARGGGE